MLLTHQPLLWLNWKASKNEIKRQIFSSKSFNLHFIPRIKLILLESLWRLPFALILKLHLLCKCKEILMQLCNSALILNNVCKTRLSLAVGKWTIMKWIGENWTGLRTICQGPRTGNNLQKDLWRRKIILRYQMSFCCCWSWLHTILPSSEGSMQMNGD